MINVEVEKTNKGKKFHIELFPWVTYSVEEADILEQLNEIKQIINKHHELFCNKGSS